MLLPLKFRRFFFALFAVLCFITAIYHAIGVFYTINESPPLRHLFFVGINLFCIYGVLKQPPFFVYFIALLVIQQFYSHGCAFINSWINNNEIDWISFFVLLVLPIALLCFIEEYYAKFIEKK